jgi:hypothetical protein
MTQRPLENDNVRFLVEGPPGRSTLWSECVIQFTDDNDLEITADGRVIAVPCVRIVNATVTNATMALDLYETTRIVGDAFWVNTAERNRVAIDVDPPISVPRDLEWIPVIRDHPRDVSVRKIYINVEDPDQFFRALTRRRSMVRRSREHLSPLNAEPLTEEELALFELNASMGSELQDCMVAHKREGNDLVYRFAIQDELTEYSWYELTQSRGTPTGCFLLKHVVLALLQGIDGSAWVERSLTTDNQTTKTQIYNDGRFVVIDHENEERWINPTLEQEYELMELSKHELVSIENEYSKIWQLAQAVAKAHHAEH